MLVHRVGLELELVDRPIPVFGDVLAAARVERREALLGGEGRPHLRRAALPVEQRP